jgi:hypothetical protein
VPRPPNALRTRRLTRCERALNAAAIAGYFAGFHYWGEVDNAARLLLGDELPAEINGRPTLIHNDHNRGEWTLREPEKMRFMVLKWAR